MGLSRNCLREKKKPIKKGKRWLGESEAAVESQTIMVKRSNRRKQKMKR